jgi:hypothetical protein
MIGSLIEGGWRPYFDFYQRQSSFGRAKSYFPRGASTLASGASGSKENKGDLAMEITAQARKTIILRVRKICKIVVLSFAGVLFLYDVPDASAQKKKISYEQAFAKCKEDVNRTLPTEYHSAGRYARGASCMKQYGFNLKKSAKF